MAYAEPEQTRRLDRGDNAAALIAYVLHLIGAATGLTSVIGLIINYIKRGESSPALSSHHSWMIRSFWWALLWSIIGVLTVFFLIGYAILGLTWLWYVYRHVRGLLRLLDDRPMPT
ncbi:MAG TPA: hypothetical protein VFH85_09835 [Gammaproteobacteria bacterium]|nr:hypothetical protein [Gammaproteobacteria bacterium]